MMVRACTNPNVLTEGVPFRSCSANKSILLVRKRTECWYASRMRAWVSTLHRISQRGRHGVKSAYLFVMEHTAALGTQLVIKVRKNTYATQGRDVDSGK